LTLRVVRPGLLSTVQDRGRHGMQHLGIVPCGAMDPVAAELANALVGNGPEAATLEITIVGPELEFGARTLVALCGAEFEALADGAPFPLDRPVLLEPGVRLAIRSARRGARAYLAVAGGIAVGEAIGSRSTYLPAGFGGLQGRALRAGDVLPLAADVAERSAQRVARLASVRREGLATVRWSAPSLTLPEREPVLIHALEGLHFARFEPAAQRALFDADWRLAPDSNRMGYRLAGPTLARRENDELLSGPTCLGTVQVPSGGAPIVLMADHQTTGGYPHIAEVASADVPRLAQLAPGATLRFARCTLEEARALRGALRARVSAAVRAIGWDYSR
jgi:antagonist of KipI